MDESKIKRILITLLVAIAIIMLAKFMLTKSYTNLNKAAAKKQTAVQQQPVVPPDAPVVETTMPDDTMESAAASSVENTAQ